MVHKHESMGTPGNGAKPKMSVWVLRAVSRHIIVKIKQMSIIHICTGVDGKVFGSRCSRQQAFSSYFVPLSCGGWGMRNAG